MAHTLVLVSFNASLFSSLELHDFLLFLLFLLPLSFLDDPLFFPELFLLLFWQSVGACGSGVGWITGGWVGGSVREV
jgi:hypothetical protein